MEFSQEQLRKTHAQIVHKAWDDANFKNDLIANPVKAIESLGYKIEYPQGHTFVVNDQTDESVTYINIPQKPNIDNLVLTDEQLEMISGGEVVVACAIGAAFIAGAAVGVAIYDATHN